MTKNRLVCATLALCALACPARAEDPAMDNPFGVLDFLHWDHPWNNYQYSSEAEVRRAARLMKQAGVGMVRMDFLWQDIEPRKGESDFAKYDMIVETLSREGIGILGVLEYATDWSSPTGEWNNPDPDNGAFLAYVKKVAGRYKGRVNHWEIWNEPNSPVYWKLQDGLATYCRLLAAAYRTLKETDPGCTVLNGGLTHDLSAVNRLYDNGGKGSFDALNIHVFLNPAIEGQGTKGLTAYVKACARVMARNGDREKAIWVTETGCPGVRGGTRTKPWWLGKNPNEREQARWVTAVYATLLAEPRVEKVFWAFFRDTDEHWKDGTDYFGLIRNDFTPKPAFGAYRRASREWGGRNK